MISEPTVLDLSDASKDDLLADLDAFTSAYLECALWSTTTCDDDGNMSEALDENHDIDDLDLESLKAAISDCTAFQEENADDLEGLDGAQAGHDFWLTRNGHGAGFWDRGLGELGERLSKASKAYGSVDLYVCDGVIYGHR